MEENLLEVYISSLEEHIENKKYFLKQAENAIKTLQATSHSSKQISDEEWQSFLKKPMFFPDRSDPIGLTLASVGMRTRKSTSLEWLTDKENDLNEMRNMVEYQMNVNNDLTVLIELLEQKDNASTEKSELEINASAQTPKQRNIQLLSQLEHFVKNFLSVDMADAEDIESTIYDDVMSLIQRLINYDTTLKITDFHHSSRGLYRLLLRSNLIEIHNGENDERYVHLLDFANSRCF